MTREKARRVANIMLAYADGKEIEQPIRSRNAWAFTPHPIFDWDNFEYQIKSKEE